MSNTLIPFPPREIKAGSGRHTRSAPSVRIIQLELSAHLADRIKVAAGYASKSLGEWTRDAPTALLDMDLAG
jgi:hypothetical protein